MSTSRAIASMPGRPASPRAASITCAAARAARAGSMSGAYGYVEDLVPKPAPAPVEPCDLPELLRAPGVAVQADNGGFVHAPSLAHAVTAAVLRNGYLTHAEPGMREVMSVNLTSRRVRAAMGLIEGVRAGQDLAALLGYQLERGLHERHPGIELDAVIYTLRARFPMVSRRLTPVDEDAPAEVIEARNVVDGEDFLDHVRANPAYPYGVDGLPAPGTAEAAAIKARSTASRKRSTPSPTSCLPRASTRSCSRTSTARAG